MSPAQGKELFARLFDPREGAKARASVMVVAAHPDDGVIGAGAWLRNRAASQVQPDRLRFTHTNQSRPVASTYFPVASTGTIASSERE